MKRNPVFCLMILVSAAVLSSPLMAAVQQKTFLGQPMNEKRAMQMARSAGFELIDYHGCSQPADACIRLAVKAKDGEALLYELEGNACAAEIDTCVGGFTVRNLSGAINHWLGLPGEDEATVVAAKLSAAPGNDGAPSDPQDKAQANATNEILESLGDGNYDNEIDQFWQDLESIQTWNQPSWIEPDRVNIPVKRDSIILTNGHDVNPAALVSGRFLESSDKDCGFWVGSTSTRSPLQLSRNCISNAVAEGCDSEVAVFSQNGAAVLEKPEHDWSKNGDTLSVSLGPRIEVPTTVWVLQPQSTFEAESTRLNTEIDTANTALKTSRCGIRLHPIDIRNASAAAPSAVNPLGCASIETVFKPIGFQANRMNIYIVDALIAEDRTGVACTAESDNVIVLDKGRSGTALAHEFGHWFDLWHVDVRGVDPKQKDMPLVHPDNIMSTGGADDMFTAGQCYRMNFSKDSYINKQGLRQGRTKNCAHLQEADGKCPGLKNEF